MKRFLATVVLLTGVIAARADTDEFDAALHKQAPKLLEYVQKKNCRNIAMLKFLARKGDGPLTDNIGPLNMSVAERVEVAITLALPNDEIGIVRNASETIAKNIPGKGHLDPAWCKKCARYSKFLVAWGDPEKEVVVDCFITGVVTLSADLKTTTVNFWAFGRDGLIDKEVGSFTVDTTPRVLGDAGYSYLITPKTAPTFFDGSRGFVDKKQVKKTVVDQTIANATAGKDPAVKPPVEPTTYAKDSPVRITVLYNDSEMEPTNGTIAEPKTGDRVRFRLENTSKTDTYGVVLKVNGENTIFHERFDDKDCMKWILQPGEKAFVAGFQESDDSRTDFRVLSAKESEESVVRYGEHTGTFQVAVFRGKLVEKKEPDKTKPIVKPAEEEVIIAAISRGGLPTDPSSRSSDLKSLQAKLRERDFDGAGSRGAIGEGNMSENKIKKVIFEADPPLVIIKHQIRYYTPGSK
jgi:hypothetical protein